LTKEVPTSFKEPLDFLSVPLKLSIEKDKVLDEISQGEQLLDLCRPLQRKWTGCVYQLPYRRERAASLAQEVSSHKVKTLWQS